jgi:hypothetical protein
VHVVAKRLLFTVQTPVGKSVSLSRDRWRQIVRYKHPAMATHQKAVRACLESPTVVRASAKDADVHQYYAPSGDAYLCVVTGPVNDKVHFVITAYFTKNVKRGTELWKK